ncbi:MULTISPECIES: 2TM domain-containing protein [Paenibacillus]|uniref:2TM domain-containing protein n=1 Tax=Paenibacillus TaxID=44249 RepID=UPI0008384C6B|nr:MULTISPECIES: 2TM domain-containing protein [Paenibacillus]GIP24799.1 putative membrane protein YmcC [Paenibacillus sp. J22TS3]
MIGWLIVGCEIAFWVFVLAGLCTRYLLKNKFLGGLLLLCTPLVDLVLLIATAVDLKQGAEATAYHGVAAIYLGSTVAFGHRMIKWADERFAYKFAGGSKPAKKPKGGAEHARRERAGWYRHLLAWVIGSAILALLILWVGEPEKTKVFEQFIMGWGTVLGIDFLISFSYTLWPREVKKGHSVD